MKKILILGGTRFIGRVLVEEMRKRSKYDITLFNRQVSSPGLFPEIKKIKGDRNSEDIKQIGNKDWDCVIDLSCYFPDSLTETINSLGNFKGKYIFISTISVYDFDKIDGKNIREEDETLRCSPSESKDTSMITYGKRKAECERILSRENGFEKIILRPSVVYGKYDVTDRFYFWLYRVRHAMPLLIPSHPEEEITLTYVKDLAEIILHFAEAKAEHDIYNAVTHEPFSLSKMIQMMEAATARDTEKFQVSADFLTENKVKPGNELPLWFNSNVCANHEKLKKESGIKFTSFQRSVEEICEYYEALNWPLPVNSIETSHEKALLEKARKGTPD